MEPNIRTEGIFRIPANVKLKECLREAYDRNQQFIVWKDNGVALPIHGVSREALAEIEQKEAYGAFMAASLIKLWYSALREPIFSQSTYPLLREQKEESDTEAVLQSLSPSAQEILSRHLFPLLASVAAESTYNKMTAENLAVCFAPALVCGTDAVEDAKMSSIVKRILTKEIENWDDSKSRRATENFSQMRKSAIVKDSPVDNGPSFLPPRRKTIEVPPPLPVRPTPSATT